MESPIQFFSRATTRAVDLGGESWVPADACAVHANAAANRDERYYEDSDVFDIFRNPVDHLVFDFGIHQRARWSLTTREGHALIPAE